MTSYTPEEIALAESIADDFEKGGCLHGDWRDAYRAALAAIRATTERADKLAEDHDFPFFHEFREALRQNHHLKDRPDAG